MHREKHRLAGVGNTNYRRVERGICKAVKNVGVDYVDVRVLRVHGNSSVSERLV